MQYEIDEATGLGSKVLRLLCCCCCCCRSARPARGRRRAGVVTSLHVSTFCPITGPTTDCIAFCQIERKSVRRADESFTGY